AGPCARVRGVAGGGSRDVRVSGPGQSEAGSAVVAACGECAPLTVRGGGGSGCPDNDRRAGPALSLRFVAESGVGAAFSWTGIRGEQDGGQSQAFSRAESRAGARGGGVFGR